MPVSASALARLHRRDFPTAPFEAPPMRLPRVRFTVRSMMAAVALAALAFGAWVWYRKPPPSPHALALTLALGTPTTSDYEATAIYHAAMFHEKVKPGCLTSLTTLPRVKTTRIEEDRPLPLSWSVVFTDR